MTAERTIRYFDHAATSWPKPPEVIAAVARAMTEAGGNPGRGSHSLAIAAVKEVSAARSALAALLGVADVRDLAFTPGCTEALNIVLKGSLAPGDRVVVSSVEHNAVARPLAALAATGVDVVQVRADAEGHMDADEVERAVAAAPTRAVVCQHASNVTGVVQPVGDLADIAHAHGAVLIVDGAQAVGHLDVDLGALGADAYAFPGHKALLGPQGIGVLYLAPGFEPVELVQGGSGVRSTGMAQPTERPDRYEAGTGNTPAAAGLAAGVAVVAANGTAIHAAERRMTRRLHEGLAALPGITVYGPPPGAERVPVVSVTHARLTPDELAFSLDTRYGIAARSGLACTPWTHETIGSGESGVLRFSPGFGTTDDDVDAVLVAMAELVR